MITQKAPLQKGERCGLLSVLMHELAASLRLASRQLLFLGTSIVPTTADSLPLAAPLGAALRPTTGGGHLHLPCRYIQALCFMQGFLPHPDSQELVQLLLLPNL